MLVLTVDVVFLLCARWTTFLLLILLFCGFGRDRDDFVVVAGTVKIVMG
jgi:hypothetical protein